MAKKFVGILLVILITLNAGVCTFGAGGLKAKPDVLDLTYILTDKEGNADTEITSGGTLEVNLTLKNNTSQTQPYVVMLQILNEANKVSLKSESGSLNPAQQETICLSDGFSETETDFSKYSAEVYIWSDMTSMQPISTYSVFGSDNNDIYAYKIDDDLVYTNNNTSLSYYFGKTYSGTPNIRPIFYDLGAAYTVTPSIGEVTLSKQNYNFKAVSQLGSVKDYYLELFKVTDETDPKNADLKSITLRSYAQNGTHNGFPVLYPAFSKDITEYTIISYAKSYAASLPTFETVNSDAAVALTASPDTSLSNTSAVYTVTSADGSVTKDYTLNYVAIDKATTRLNITDIVNGYTESSGTCLEDYTTGNDIHTISNKMYIQDGTIEGKDKAIKRSGSIMEIDISAGPQSITDGILKLTLSSSISGRATAGGTLRVYKVSDSIYNSGDISTIPANDVGTYFGDEMTSVNIVPKTATNADMYFINVGKEYYNSLKASGKTKMYIGICGESSDPEKGLGVVFMGNNTTTYAFSSFHYVSE